MTSSIETTISLRSHLSVHLFNKRLRSGTCYSAVYLSQTRHL